MKTTVVLPNELVMQAKLQALHQGRTLRDLVESGLRRELAAHNTAEVHPEPIQWIIAQGGLPTAFDTADRSTYPRP